MGLGLGLRFAEPFAVDQARLTLTLTLTLSPEPPSLTPNP